MLTARDDLEDTSRSEVELVTKEMMSLIQKQESTEVHDKDIDELLGWTNTLNFDQ